MPSQSPPLGSVWLSPREMTDDRIVLLVKDHLLYSYNLAIILCHLIFCVPFPDLSNGHINSAHSLGFHIVRQEYIQVIMLSP